MLDPKMSWSSSTGFVDTYDLSPCWGHCVRSTVRVAFPLPRPITQRAGRRVQTPVGGECRPSRQTSPDDFLIISSSLHDFFVLSCTRLRRRADRGSGGAGGTGDGLSV